MSSSHCEGNCMRNNVNVEKRDRTRRWEDGGVRQKRRAPAGRKLLEVSSTHNSSALHKHLQYTTTSFTMTDPALQIAETIQTSTIKRHPSPRHDLNPSTAASEKQPVVTSPGSDAGSIPSDIVDESRVIRPVRRRPTLPPMPDLRFEQSYLASIKDADTWGRVTWITVRDQVSSCIIADTEYRIKAREEKYIDIQFLFDRSSSLSSKAQSGLWRCRAGAFGTATLHSAVKHSEAGFADGGMKSITGKYRHWQRRRTQSWLRRFEM